MPDVVYKLEGGALAEKFEICKFPNFLDRKRKREKSFTSREDGKSDLYVHHVVVVVCTRKSLALICTWSSMTDYSDSF